MARDDDPILGPRKTWLGGPGPRVSTIGADEWNRLVDKVFALEAALVAGGITELSGDVAAGPGGGSQAATVARLQGRDFTADAPVTGNPVVWTGSEYAAEELPIRSVVGSTKLLESDYIVVVDNSGGSADVEGPTFVTGKARGWLVKKSPGANTNTLALVPDAAELIENAAGSMTFPNSGTSASVGGCWAIVRDTDGNLFFLG